MFLRCFCKKGHKFPLVDIDISRLLRGFQRFSRLWKPRKLFGHFPDGLCNLLTVMFHCVFYHQDLIFKIFPERVFVTTHTFERKKKTPVM